MLDFKEVVDVNVIWCLIGDMMFSKVYLLNKFNDSKKDIVFFDSSYYGCSIFRN